MYSCKSGCIRKDCCFRAKVFLSGKMVVVAQSGCVWAKGVVIGKKWLFLVKVVFFEQKLLYSDKSGCIQAKVIVFGQSG